MLLMISGTAYAAGPAPATVPAQAQPTAPRSAPAQNTQAGATRIGASAGVKIVRGDAAEAKAY